MNTETLHVECGDSRALLAELPDASVDSVVCDPPYFLNFMGRDWDKLDGNAAACPDFWRDVLRVLKPGGHLLAFGAPRTYHRLAVAVEDAGFEIRDSLHWCFGTGFPKNHDVGKAIDKAAGVERGVVGVAGQSSPRGSEIGPTGLAGGDYLNTAPATDAAKQWDGWGTALKPSHESIILARKPLTGTVAQNVIEHGTGALNVDSCRVATGTGDDCNRTRHSADTVGYHGGKVPFDTRTSTQGRWPPNLLLTHAPTCTETECAEDCPVAEMGRQSGTRKAGKGSRRGQVTTYGGTEIAPRKAGEFIHAFNDTGTAARYFPCFRYQAKAPRKERDAGLTSPLVDTVKLNSGGMGERRRAAGQGRGRNAHPTVKPIELMRWLCRLVTPPGGLVLDPFTGSGSTGCAAALEGFRFLGFELDEGHAETARARIEHHRKATEQCPDQD